MSLIESYNELDTMERIDFIADNNYEIKASLIEDAYKKGFLTFEEKDWELAKISAFRRA